MAKAKEVKLGSGSIFLNGFSKEKLEVITQLLVNFHEQSLLDPKNIQEEVVPQEPISEMKETAIGVTRDKTTGKAIVATILYDSSTGEAKVKNLTECDGLRDATNKFKMFASDLNFV